MEALSMKSRLFSIAVVSMLLFVSQAHAVCATATTLRANGGGTDFDFVVNGGSNDYTFTGTAGNGYYVEVAADYESVGTDLTVTIGSGACPGAAIAGIVDTTSVEPVLTNGTRKSFIMPGAAGTTQTVQINVADGGTVGHYIRLQVGDLTLFNPGWSTFGGFNTFYTLMNTTHSTITGTLTLFNNSGTVAATTAVTLGPLGSATAIKAFNTTAAPIAMAPNNFGYATFAFAGSQGSVTANANIANFSVNAIQPSQFLPVRQ
jgi:hypothetical protein